jgi:hypothetical protein
MRHGAGHHHRSAMSQYPPPRRRTRADGGRPSSASAGVSRIGAQQGPGIGAIACRLLLRTTDGSPTRPRSLGTRSAETTSTHPDSAIKGARAPSLAQRTNGAATSGVGKVVFVDDETVHLVRRTSVSPANDTNGIGRYCARAAVLARSGVRPARLRRGAGRSRTAPRTHQGWLARRECTSAPSLIVDEKKLITSLP